MAAEKVTNTCFEKQYENNDVFPHLDNVPVLLYKTSTCAIYFGKKKIKIKGTIYKEMQYIKTNPKTGTARPLLFSFTVFYEK